MVKVTEKVHSRSFVVLLVEAENKQELDEYVGTYLMQYPYGGYMTTVDEYKFTPGVAQAVIRRLASCE